MLMEAETVCNHARWPALSGESAKPRGRLSCVGCGVQPPIHSQQTFGFQAMPRSPLDANSGLLPKVDAYYLDWVWETATTQLGMVAALPARCGGTCPWSHATATQNDMRRPPKRMPQA